jgi:hypothetical protein
MVSFLRRNYAGFPVGLTRGAGTGLFNPISPSIQIDIPLIRSEAFMFQNNLDSRSFLKTESVLQLYRSTIEAGNVFVLKRLKPAAI